MQLNTKDHKIEIGSFYYMYSWTFRIKTLYIVIGPDMDRPDPTYLYIHHVTFPVLRKFKGRNRQ